MWPGFRSLRRRHMWVEFVVGCLPCSERFFSGYYGYSLSSKTSISKIQFDQEFGRRRTTLWVRCLQIIIYLFIYLYGVALVVRCLSCSCLFSKCRSKIMNFYFVIFQGIYDSRRSFYLIPGRRFREKLTAQFVIKLSLPTKGS